MANLCLNFKTFKDLNKICLFKAIYVNFDSGFDINILIMKFFNQMASQLKSKNLEGDTKSSHNKK
ncbi:hypothetical protein DU68_19715 [Methanosarcina mazei]|uniref:Uncharacterized protein n=1 Tax=Methanosarcina mazei TaxID=2209 RepID=A0A0F8QFG8_METMZ|nr:hypothetical protein DU33_12165 [Methanosarcina mazei]KKG59143.1 hypothetical protein DU64_01660 [Methanosarcina mazei]KKG60269.1 hypothetical protein DU45_20050 [Methanosarcina mazei]KKG96965.1 hypothetical protein DU68_19715 [Methanosarcina mazei]KKH02684.1 hypothetical protein DU66_02740 [Methanosarcina mazei]